MSARWILVGLLSCAAFAAEPDGATVYKQRCAACHDRSLDRAPARESLAQRAPEDVLRALTTGTMKQQAAGLSEADMRALAAFLTGKAFGSNQPSAAVNFCAGTPPPIDLSAPSWTGWGNDVANDRYQKSPGISASDVPRLKVKWAFAYPNRGVFGQPTVTGGRLFVSTESGMVYSLNPDTGCVYWMIENKAGVRSAIQIGPLPDGSPAKYAAYFGDEKARVHAVDASTGAPIWETKLDDHPVARITGSPVLYKDRLYVPVSSLEEALLGRNPKYECCKFQGAIAALDAYTGKIIWKTRTITDPPRPFQKNSAGTQMYGPAGAAVWSAPTLDLKRRLIYAGTGNSYTESETNTTNAIIAIDMDDGSLKWSNQATTRDAFIVGCPIPGVGNCPKNPGPDVDFGSSPILHTLPSGKQVILAGQKSGFVYALDPDNKGKTLWSVQVGAGSTLGGVEWGPAADDENLYVAISDVYAPPEQAKPGLTAIRIADGEKVWNAPAPKPECSWGSKACFPSLSAAVTVIPGIVFAGSLDGHMRAYSAANGNVVWDFDTGRNFATVNGQPATGGSIDSAGPVVANGTMFLNSGYGRIAGHPGNLLLALSVEGK
jgi:polyvinyl alcohol dehydrogenase (cytochrome)